MLGNALHALSSETAEQQADPPVEQAVLRAFRKQDFGAQVVVMPQPAASSLWTLSRVFEYGAYAAVAAALAVGVFLGVRVLRDQQSNVAPVQATVSAPQTAVSTRVGQNESTELQANKTDGAQAKVPTVAQPVVATKRAVTVPATTKTGSSETAEYVPLMLCDPLICSGDEQVIRMELPAGAQGSADANAGQTVMADVVVGEDGLVRGMRIVH